MKSPLSLESLANRAVAWHLEDAGLNEDDLPARDTFNRIKHLLPRATHDEMEGSMYNIGEGREHREFMVRQAEKEVDYKRSVVGYQKKLDRAVAIDAADPVFETLEERLWVAQSFVDELVEERQMNTIVLMEMYGEGWVRKNDLRAMLAKLAPLGFA